MCVVCVSLLKVVSKEGFKCLEKRSAPSSIRRLLNQHFQLISTPPPISIALLTPARLNVLGKYIPSQGQVCEVGFFRLIVIPHARVLDMTLAAWQGFMNGAVPVWSL